MDQQQQEKLIHHLTEAVAALEAQALHLAELEEIAKHYPQNETEFLKQLSPSNRIKFIQLSEKAKQLGNLT